MKRTARRLARLPIVALAPIVMLAACRDDSVAPPVAGSTGAATSTGHVSGEGTSSIAPSSTGESTGPIADDTTGSPPPICSETDCEWPNAESFANSDPWLPAHHDMITRMRPRILALNYVNARSMDEMTAQLQEMIAIVAESSRYHGYADPSAPAFVQPELAYAVDLRDAEPPADWPYRNSTLYPREDPQEGAWSFDYEALFTERYAPLLGITDPDGPDDPPHPLRLCDAIDRGLVHEIWIYGDADVPDVSAAEMLELKPQYDEDGNRKDLPMHRCAGNGCFDEEDVIPCARTVRIGWVNNTRGPGCYLESLSHAFEGMGRKGYEILPYLSRYFPEISGQALDDAYGLSVESWYACPYGEPCLSYPSQTSVSYQVSATVSGTIRDYDPICGAVHWAPNARSHYDLASPAAVRTSCPFWRDGSGRTVLYDGSQHAAYAALAPDCMGPFLVWWRQNLPGYKNAATDDRGEPMRNFWPYLYY